MSWINFAVIALLASLTGLLSQQADAEPGEVALVKGAEFVKVRPQLIAAGWKPVVSDYLMEDGEPWNRFPPASLLYRAGYVEVQECSQGSVYCILNYRRGKECLQLFTKGEYGKFNGRQYPLLDKWSNECFRH
ncbi:hypothetical protein [Ferrovibrio sp.]|jgi:hypothetical protein|uniref:hypothetical protein n=1 Tax=Ferrovibrio sp. TaxID=1917215 RepID=UPI0035AE6E51